MSKSLDINLSTQIAEQISSKANKCFDNAYQAALLDNSYLYVQGFFNDANDASRPRVGRHFRNGIKIILLL